MRVSIDDKVLQRLLQGETHRLNQGLVEAPVFLTDLRSMEPPRARTRGGTWHVFDRAALEDLARPLSPLVRATVRVPLRFYIVHDAGGTCYLADGPAIEALQQHGAAHTQPRDGRLWMALPLAARLAQRWPTLIEFVRA